MKVNIIMLHVDILNYLACSGKKFPLRVRGAFSIGKIVSEFYA